MPNRHGGEYSFGFNGMEQDNEVKGKGSSYTTEFRQYDSRLFRWLSVDPLFNYFPWQSPYVAFDNNPIYYNDPLGAASEKGDKENSDDEPIDMGTLSEVSVETKRTVKFKRRGNSVFDKELVIPSDKDLGNEYLTRQGVNEYREREIEFRGKMLNENFWRVPDNVHFIFEDITPEIYKNTLETLKYRPQWRVLTYNGGGRAARINRRKAVKKCPTCPPNKNSRDEFPYATTTQGGTLARVWCVPPIENSIQGAHLRWRVYRNMKKSDTFMIILVDKFNKRTPLLQPLVKPINPRPVGGPIIPFFIPSPVLAPVLLL